MSFLDSDSMLMNHQQPDLLGIDFFAEFDEPTTLKTPVPMELDTPITTTPPSSIVKVEPSQKAPMGYGMFAPKAPLEAVQNRQSIKTLPLKSPFDAIQRRSSMNAPAQKGNFEYPQKRPNMKTIYNSMAGKTPVAAKTMMGEKSTLGGKTPIPSKTPYGGKTTYGGKSPMAGKTTFGVKTPLDIMASSFTSPDSFTDFMDEESPFDARPTRRHRKRSSIMASATSERQWEICGPANSTLIPVHIKGRRSEAAMDTVDERLYSSIVYEVTLSSTASIKNIVRTGPIFVQLRIVYEDNFESEVLKNGKNINLYKGEENWDLQKDSVKFRLRFNSCSYHHDGKKFRLRLNMFQSGQLLSSQISPPFEVRARRHTQRKSSASGGKSAYKKRCTNAEGLKRTEDILKNIRSLLPQMNEHQKLEAIDMLQRSLKTME